MMETKINVLSFGMVNAYLLQGEKNILVDSGPARKYKKLEEQVNACGIGMKDIDLIIITHAHSDHYGNVLEIKKGFDTPVAIHESSFTENTEVKQVEAIPNGFLPSIMIKLFGNMKVDSFIPDIAINSDFDLNDYGVNGEVIHIPGHTKDSIGILIDGHRMITGDTIGSNRKKKPVEAMFLNDREQYKNSIEKILGYNPTEIYCSHGSVLTGNAIEKIREWI